MINNVKYLPYRVKPGGISEWHLEERVGLLHFLRKWGRWPDGQQTGVQPDFWPILEGRFCWQQRERGVFPEQYRAVEAPCGVNDSPRLGFFRRPLPYR
jgi:hypothetical protein